MKGNTLQAYFYTETRKNLRLKIEPATFATDPEPRGRKFNSKPEDFGVAFFATDPG